MRPDNRPASASKRRETARSAPEGYGTDAKSVLPASPTAAIAHNQGEHVRPTEHNTKTHNATTGIFATLRALLSAKGTPAPKSTTRDGTGAPTCALQGKSTSVNRTGAPASASSALGASLDESQRQVHRTPALNVAAPHNTSRSQLSPLSAAQGRRGASRSPACLSSPVEGAPEGVPYVPREVPGGGRGTRVRTQAPRGANPAGRTPANVNVRASGALTSCTEKRSSGGLGAWTAFTRRYAPLLVVLGALAGASPASAAQAWWHLQSGTRPSFLAPESENGQLVATVSNLGDVSSTGQVTITDTLPTGLSAKSIEAEALEGTGGEPNNKSAVCSPHPTVERPLVCTITGVAPFEAVELRIAVVVDPGAHECKQNAPDCEQNLVSVSAPDSSSVSISRPVTISEEPVPFGVEAYEVTPEEEGGAPTTQAGKHPYQVTGTLTMNQAATTRAKVHLEGHPVALAKDLAGLLPPGLIGNPTPFGKCSVTQLDNTGCPANSIIGVVTVTVNEPVSFGGLATFTTPIANMEPAVGEAARFGFFAASVPVFLSASVRSGGDYGVTLGGTDIPQVAAFLAYKLTFWGVPGDASHDNSRTQECLLETRQVALGQTPLGGCKPLGELSPPPFLAMPTSCSGPLITSGEADAWDEPHPEGKRVTFPETEPMPAMQGCSKLPFEAQVNVTPDGNAASTPTGLSVDVHVPQGSILNATSLASSDVRNITVTLPEGVQVNPAGGNGLQACSEGLVGWEGFKTFEDEPGVSVASFTPNLPEPEEAGVNFCSTASKIGTVEVSTPLLPADQHLVGSVYLASQNENPFGSLLALYLVARDPISGTVFKALGETKLSESGQIIGVFKNNPQVAFEDATLHFFGGERGPLSTPSRCGAYTTTASFLPWSAEPWDEASETIAASSTFDITTGPHGTPCPGPGLPFSPSLTGGTTNINAGGFTELSTTIGREDGQQNLQQVTLHMPAGLSGLLKGVTLCPEAQANAGECGPESLIGETTVQAGVGNDPVSVKGGKVYLTEKYEGAPFGLSIVNPVKAGPFDLEHDTSKPATNMPPCDCVVVRATVQVDPTSAALTITTNTKAQGYNIPDMIDGIPVQIKAVNVTITRPGFTFNPTSCNPAEITGTIGSDEAGSSPGRGPLPGDQLRLPEVHAAGHAHRDRAGLQSQR